MKLFDNGIIGNDSFMFGSSTAPSPTGMDWPREEWDGDLRQMKELNLNTVRVWAPWDRIEKQEGVFDFSAQDHLFKIAKEQGIRVILNIGGAFDSLCGCFTPRYLYEKKLVTLRQSSPGEKPDFSALTAAACWDDPDYQERAFRFMRRVVERYKEESALVGWMIWNEPCAHFCYCEHTVREFHKYLTEHYDFEEFLKSFNQYPVTYRSWEEIPAPTGPRVQSIWFAWVRFNQERLTKKMMKIRNLVEEIDGTHRFTTSNIVYHMAALEGPMDAPHYGLHLANVGKTMSLQGASCYSIEHFYDLYPAYTISYKLSRLRSVSSDPQRRFVILETGAGGNLRTHTPQSRTQLLWQQIANNAKGILMFHYRSRVAGVYAGMFNLMKWNGKPNARAMAVSKVSGAVQKYAKIFNTAYPEKQAAVWTPEETQTVMESICGKFFGLQDYVSCHDARFGAYKLLWDLHVPADCIAENNFGDMSSYQVILVPMQSHLRPEYAELFRKYVENGGTLIVESPFGYLDAEAHLFREAPGYGLTELFGGTTSDLEHASCASPIRFLNGKCASAHKLFCEYDALKDAQVLATYADGTAAVIRKQTGKGVTVLCGYDVFRQYAQKPDRVMSAFLKEEILKSGVRPAAKLVGKTEDIEVQRLAGENGSIYLILNHGEGSRILTCTLQESSAKFTDVLTAKEYPAEFTFTLPAKEQLVLVQKSSRS